MAAERLALAEPLWAGLQQNPMRFSCGGDGRPALGPVLCECLVSEAMAALGVPLCAGF